MGQKSGLQAFGTVKAHRSPPAPAPSGSGLILRKAIEYQHALDIVARQASQPDTVEFAGIETATRDQRRLRLISFNALSMSVR